jgi:hypothetical protein
MLSVASGLHAFMGQIADMFGGTLCHPIHHGLGVVHQILHRVRELSAQGFYLVECRIVLIDHGELSKMKWIDKTEDKGQCVPHLSVDVQSADALHVQSAATLSKRSKNKA